MGPRTNCQPFSLACLLVAVVLFTACSYLTDFVVVNKSDRPIEVRYKLRKPASPLSPSRIPLLPGVKSTSELDQQVPWRELGSSEYAFDADKRVVSVSVLPGQVLRIAQYNLQDGNMTNAEQAKMFFVEELAVSGNNGEVIKNGDDVYESFVPESTNIRALVYR